MKRYIYLMVFMISLLLCIPPGITADGPPPQGITVDGSICPEGRLDLAGPNYEIKADYGKQAGGNLFHSFEQFNLHNGESATFTAPESVMIDNIINRVTGGSPSWIDGILRSTIPGADLYFINPAGMMFGSHASLDLSGSFHVSTADYLRLGETERFYSLPIEGEELSVAPPSAFGFLDDSVAPISFEGSGSFFMENDHGLNGIKVKAGETISIIGGDINIGSGMLDDESQVESRIKAPGGRLNIAAVASSGEVVLAESDLAVDTFTKMGNINITEGSYTDVTGAGGGKVYIRGENFVIDNSNASTLSQDVPAGVYASSNGDVDEGCIDIELGADLIIKNDGSIQSKNYSAGGGRRIKIEAENIEISNGGEIVSGTDPDSSGEGADIDIQANGSILITGKSSIDLSEIFSYTEGTGAAGDIRIAAKDITVNDDAGISGCTGWCVSDIAEIPEKPGRGPDISINSQTLNLTGGGSIKNYCIFSGIGGNVSIESEALTLTGGGSIESYSFYSGVGGDVSISSKDSILIDGKGEYSSLIEVGTLYGSAAGDISLSTKDLTVSNEGIIRGLLENNTQMDSRSADIILDIDNLEITDGGRIYTEVEGIGGGGNLFVEAKEKIVISGKAENTELTILGVPSFLGNMTHWNQSESIVSIKTPKLILFDEGELTSTLFMTADPESRGSDVLIDVETLEIRDGASIGTFNMSEGRGGDLTITAKESILITGKSQGLIGMDSEIRAQTYGSGSSGNLSLETNDLRLTNYGSISTISGFSTISDLSEQDIPGESGDIRINVGSLEITDHGCITSERNGAGKSGDINITSERYILIDGFTTKIPYFNASIEAKSTSGNSGKIEIATPELTLLNNGVISNDTEDGFGNDIFIDTERVTLMSGKITSKSKGSGKAGNIYISASDSISMKTHLDYLSDNSTDDKLNTRALISTSAEGNGLGGDITINAFQLDIRDGAHIQSNSEGLGDAGDITIKTEEYVKVSGDKATSSITAQTSSNEEGAGDAGEIFIETKNLNISNGGLISAETSGSGCGGGITLDIDDRIILSGENTYGQSVISSETGSSGNSGKIKMVSKNLILEEGGSITTSTEGAGEGGNIDITAEHIELAGDKTGIFAETLDGDIGSGNAGNITVTSNDLSIAGGALISNGTSGAGDGGQITLNVSRLTMKNGYIETSSTMQSDSEGGDAGNAGNINIAAADSMDMDESFISAEAADAGGGRIDIQAQNRVYLLDSELATSVHGGAEDAGNITIDPRFVILNNSKITADAHGGRGGNIDIVADYFIQSPDSKISASSDENIDGEINIQAPEVDIASDIATLPSDFYDASELMQPPCGLRTREGLSSLVVKERDGVPFMMDDWLPIFPASSDPSYKDIYRAHEYQTAGQYQKALSLLLGMHPNMGQSSDRSLKTLFFTTLGDLYLCMGNTKKASNYLMESIEEARMGGDPLLMAAGLNNLGNFFSSAGKYVKALAAYEEALRLIKEKGKETASKLLINIVRLRHYNRVGYNDLCEDMNLLRSLKEMQKEYADADQGSNKHWFASLRGKTQELLPDEVSFFPSSLSGNYAEDIMESIEKTYQTINTIPASYQKTVDMICLGILALGIQNDIQKEGAGYESKLKDIASHLFTGASRVAEELGDLGLLAYSNGYLGQVYESEGRYQEAFTLTRKAIFAAQQGYFPEILYLWQWQLGRLFEAVAEKDKARKAYEEAIAILKPIQKEFFTGYRNRKEVFNERVRPVYTSYAGLILKEAQDARDEEARQSKLKKARDTMEGLKIAELVDYFEDECLIDQYAGSVPLDCTPSRTALLYPIILNDRLSLLLTLPEGMQQTTIMVNSEEVFRTIKRLHTELQIPNSSSYLKDAQKVYEWIIDPIEDKLMTEEIDTLIVAPDGVFRLIPFAALYDGTSYLIEKYALATLPTIRLADIESINGEEETGVLISGLSEARQGFPPLPNVQKEIENIHTLIGGTILKDNTFTIENLKQELEYNACRIVHMASHGVFDSSAGESFLLTYDDKITMDSLAQMIQGVVYHGSPKIELLCLSACQTAKGDERAALGLGGIAVKAGVRSVIATLWPVVDESTSLLMKEFYNQLKNPDMSKTKALQSAQINILEGADYRHPFFWAPFLLIGNWL